MHTVELSQGARISTEDGFITVFWPGRQRCTVVGEKTTIDEDGNEEAELETLTFRDIARMIYENTGIKVGVCWEKE